MKECKAYIGTSGYVYSHWRGLFYPEKLSSSKWFEFYAKYFNTVEINMSFYRWPTQQTIKQWKKRVEGSKFVYTLKAPQDITHVKRLVGVKNIVKNFYKLADLLKPHLGCILFQLPPSLKFDEKRLREFIRCLDQNYKNVIEFRHKSWWNEETYKMMDGKAIFCIVSAPRLPDDFVKTREEVYIRFHGKLFWYGSNYSNAELKEWAKKIKKSKAKEVYCYFNNDFNAYAAFNALTLAKFLKE